MPGTAERSQHSVELLAPAGDMRSFRAALLAGADAIYLGLGEFNARRNAKNLSLDDLEQACRMAHLAGVKVYLTANTLLLDAELGAAIELVLQAWQRGVDAVIVQDLGLLSALHGWFPQIEVHASTQMNICNTQGVLQAKRLGASRVTLARELSLDELGVLSKLGIELEVFAHGALCICHSGQCLMSSLIGRRSANRGLCAQPCRLPYQLVDQDGRSCDVPGEHLLSPKDLCTIDILPQLIASGVASLKIEGRMKSPEYVSLVVSTYRACLDRALADPQHYSATQKERDVLAEAFSRGFSTAYLEGERGNAMMSYQRPNNRGVPVGRVTGIKDGFVEISADKPLTQGDVLEFWTSRGRHTHVLRDFQVGGREVLVAPAGSRCRMVVERPVAPGDRVFRVRSQELLGGALEGLDSAPGRPCEVGMQVAARLGEPLSIAVRDTQGRVGVATGAVVQAARTRAVTEPDIMEHVGRLGGTAYRVRSWDIQLDEGVGMGFSALHNLRRDAIAAYEALVLAPWSSRTALQVPRRFMRKAAGRVQTVEQAQAALICADVQTIQAAYQQGLRLVYVPALDLLSMGSADRDILAGLPGLEVQVLMPTTAHDTEMPELLELADQGMPVVADSMSMLVATAAKGAQVECGPRMGIMNASALASCKDMGAKRVWLSPELSLAQIKDLAASQTGEPLSLSLTVLGRQELMVTEHCQFMALGDCGRRCGTCPRRRRGLALQDAKGYVFPLRTDDHGRGHVYNSVPLDVLPAVQDLISCGVSRFIVDASLMTAPEALGALQRLQQAFQGQVERMAGSTTGHLFRGVL
ncbi:MAG: U32 family peptidase [Coriobacteriales bacterium]|nr:U32 family peptidase [Coriobacteriales bacterium]